MCKTLGNDRDTNCRSFCSRDQNSCGDLEYHDTGLSAQSMEHLLAKVSVRTLVHASGLQQAHRSGWKMGTSLVDLLAARTVLQSKAEQ